MILSSLILASTLTLSVANAIPAKPNPCTDFPYTEEENIVQVIENDTCALYRNSYFLSLVNCARQDAGEEELVPVSPETCDEYCPRFCTYIYDPVCAEYAGAHTTFGSGCEMQAISCSQKIPYTFKHHGMCEFE